MDIERLFEKEIENHLFTDFDVCVLNGTKSGNFRGGCHVSNGSRLFDVASLTKACTHLLMLKLFAEKIFSPEDSFKELIPSIQQERKDDRQLWHFLCYVVQSYGFDYESLRDGTTLSLKDTLLSAGFGHWGRRFKYDNVASAYLGVWLGEAFGNMGLEELIQSLSINKEDKGNLLFHPVSRGRIDSALVVPTRKEKELCGRVHDPLAFHHEDTELSIAGLFSDAKTIASIFHHGVDMLIASGFYDEVSKNQLTKFNINENTYGLGFDIPFQSSLEGLQVEGPMIFAGWTGCRLFFAKRPRVTICFLTNRVLCGDTAESRGRFSQFSWNVIREALRCTK